MCDFKMWMTFIHTVFAVLCDILVVFCHVMLFALMCVSKNVAYLFSLETDYVFTVLHDTGSFSDT
jgi:hypothetical protein